MKENTEIGKPDPENGYIACPFCGGNDIELSENDNTSWSVKCRDCWCGTGSYHESQKDKAAIAWNKRAA